MAKGNSKPGNKNDPKGDSAHFKGVIIRREYPESVELKYTNHVTTQQTEHEFILSFFSLLPPDYMGDEESGPIFSSDIARAKCFARIAIPKSLMPKFCKSINKVALAVIDESKDDDEKEQEDA